MLDWINKKVGVERTRMKGPTICTLAGLCVFLGSSFAGNLMSLRTLLIMLKLNLSLDLLLFDTYV